MNNESGNRGQIVKPIIVDGTFGPVTFSAFDGEDAPGPVQPDQLDDLETRHKVRLPDDYRAFMLRLNGAKPSPRGVAYRYNDAAIETPLAYVALNFTALADLERDED